MPSYHLLCNVGGLVPANTHDDQGIDLNITVDQHATIGDISDQLCEWLNTHEEATSALCLHARDPQGTTVESFPDRSALFLEWGPASGSTIWFECHDHDCDLGQDAAPPRSPVVLASPSQELRLPYGTTHLGSASIQISDRVTIAPLHSPSPRVNGQRVRSLIALGHGDIVATEGESWTVQITGTLTPPRRTQPLRAHRLRAKEITQFHPTRIEFPTAPTFARPAAFPVLSALVPLLMGVAIWVATRAIFMAFFILFSFVFVVASSIESRKETKRDNAQRRKDFHLAVGDVEQQIRDRQVAHVEYLDATCPPHSLLRSLIRDHPEELWHRSDPRTPKARHTLVRLGIADLQGVDDIIVSPGGDRSLSRSLKQQAAALERHVRPVVVDLRETGGLSITSADERGTDLLRSVVCQLAMHLGPHDLDIVVRCPSWRVTEWEWLQWLPHCSSVTVAAHQRTDLEELQSSRRVQLVVVDHVSPEMSRLIQSHIATLEQPPILLWGSDSAEGIPAQITTTCALRNDFQRACADLWMHHIPEHEEVRDIVVEQVIAEEAEWVARQLAAYYSDVAATAVTTHHGTHSVTLASLLAHTVDIDSGESIAAQWRRGHDHHELSIPIGVTSAGMLDIDLRADGPHMLIAGTTGSGKSELLRTLLISAALHNSADRLTFLLIDYKGGAAFNSISELPHAVGMITDLTPELARRALVSLHAELRRREELLNTHDVANIVELEQSGIGLPSLLVAVDEFATLKSELPEFVDGLVDIAQRGRSLGIHLVLATQRPSGVLTDQIRANIGLRIALRVTDPEESRDIIDIADAASLSRATPGRAIVRVGPNQHVQFQSAWSSAPYEPTQPVLVEPHASSDRSVLISSDHPDVVHTHAPTDIELAVRSICDAHASLELTRPVPPWLEPLPFPLTDDDPGLGPGLTLGSHKVGTCVIGMTDIPERQQQQPLQIALDQVGGVAIVGARGSGASTTLAVLVHQLQTHGPCIRTIRLSASSIPSSFRLHSDAHDAGVDVAMADKESVLRVLRAAEQLLIERSSQTTAWLPTATAPMLIVAIDGIAVFTSQYETLNRGEATDIVDRLAREGRSVGIHLIVTAERPNHIPFAMTSALGVTLQLRCNSVDDATNVGLPDWIASPDTPPGRGLIGHTTFQVAVPSRWLEQSLQDDVATANGFEASQTVHESSDTLPVLPARLSVSQVDTWRTPHMLRVRPGAGGPVRIPFALAADHLGLVECPEIHDSFLIAGPPGSGKTATLDFLVECLGARSSVNERQVIVLSTESSLPEAIHDPEHLVRTLTSLTQDGTPDSKVRIVVAMDDIDRVLDSPAAVMLEELLMTLLHQRRLTLLATGDIDQLMRSYSPVVQGLTSRRRGLLLDPDVDIHASIFHASLPRRDEIPSSPGRGWLINNKLAQYVQVLASDVVLGSGRNDELA